MNSREESNVPPASILGDHELGHFIPFRKADVIDMCLADGALPQEHHQSFRDFCRILSALFHFEYHDGLEMMKDAFAPFNPDSDTHVSEPGAESGQLEDQFIAKLRQVLTGANYVELSREDLKENLDSETRFKVRLTVDMEDFEQLLIFVRGKHERLETERSCFGLIKRDVQVPYYGRVAVYIRFKDAEHFTAKKIKQSPFKPGGSYLKLFKDVPLDDLEIVFPNVRMSMRPLDKLLLGVPAAAGGIVVLFTKLYATLLLLLGVILFWLGLRDDEVQIEQHHLIALGVGTATLGGFVFRQISKIKNRRLRYLKGLSENLYFKVLDNNAGVFNHLVDAAEEEDNKEAILAYYFILTRGGDLSEEQLDAVIERWLAEEHGQKLDFEVDDAMAKLERLGMAWRQDGKLRVKPLDEAKELLDHTWDNYFTYNGA